MDTELLKTFLEVNRTRHFGRAADILCVTPSAVSARIRLLENQLGADLFIRERNNIGLTAAGERLLAHAGNLLKALEKARLDVALGSARQQLVIASTPGVWDNLALDWSAELWASEPRLSLRLEVMNTAALRDALERGVVDLSLSLDSPGGNSLAVQPVGELALRLYSSTGGQTAEQALADHYILIDWGSVFMSQHAGWFPQAPLPRARVSTERLALGLLHHAPGAAYLAEGHAAEAVAAGTLFAVEDAPRLSLPVYAAWRQDTHLGEAIRQVLARIPPQ